MMFHLDAINLVVNIAKDAIAGFRWKGGMKKQCLMATLDIKNVFDSANWYRIIQALLAYLRKIVASYLPLAS